MKPMQTSCFFSWVALIGCFTLLSGCHSKKSIPPLPVVTILHPVAQKITPYLIETGNTVAYQSVDLVARVSGYLDTNNFVDGSMVKKNDLLFVIQPQPYQNEVISAQANLESDVAAYVYNKEEYGRQKNLYKKNATSRADLEQWQSTTAQAAAAVQAARANLRNAEINYSYTHIVAPMDGRIGRHLVDTGNLVGNGGATTLATLQQLDPIYVYFTINELDLLQIRAAARRLGLKPFENITKIPVQIALQNETGFPHSGYLDFGATDLDASTGTLQVRGVFTNSDNVLLPGLFVQARIALDHPKLQFTLPSSAVMYGQLGAYVYSVDQNNRVASLQVETGDKIEKNIVITKGLYAEDCIIVAGLENISPGDRVTVTEQAAA